MERRGFMVLHGYALPPGHSQGDSAIKVMPGRLKPSAPPRLAGEIKQKAFEEQPTGCRRLSGDSIAAG
jgi:hypothetical protein